MYNKNEKKRFNVLTTKIFRKAQMKIFKSEIYTSTFITGCL